MNPEVKKKWVEALRSGKYEQGHSWLNGRGKFCCLGVLCDIHAKDTRKKWKISRKCKEFKSYEGEFDFLPLSVQKWAGLTENSPSVLTNGEQRALTGLNDSTCLSFPEIADLIEKHL